MGCLACAVLWIGPVCSAAPFSFVTELVLKVGPDVLDSGELFLQSFVGRRKDVVFLLQGNEHFVDLEGCLTQQLLPRQTCEIKCRREAVLSICCREAVSLFWCTTTRVCAESCSR